jgi:hypothetical protein
MGAADSAPALRGASLPSQEGERRGETPQSPGVPPPRQRESARLNVRDRPRAIGEDIVGGISFSTSNRSSNRSPGVRADAASGKRAQCDQFGFWRCRKCWLRRKCTGDPYECFRRRYRTMPRDHADWPSLDRLLTTSGAGNAERKLRLCGLPTPAGIEPARTSPLPPRPAGAAAAPVMPAGESEARRRAAREAGILAKLSPDAIASLEQSLRGLGMTLEREVEPPPSGPSPPRMQPAQARPSPSRQADAEARVVVSEHTGPASPGTSSTAPALPAADLPLPAAWRWTGPLNPPQAYCDEQGRLIMPDPADVAEYNERLRRGITRGEIVRRGGL